MGPGAGALHVFTDSAKLPSRMVAALFIPTTVTGGLVSTVSISPKYCN